MANIVEKCGKYEAYMRGFIGWRLGPQWRRRYLYGRACRLARGRIIGV